MEEMNELEKIAKKILVCKKCRLWKNRKKAVPGEGNPKAKIVLVGEAPGKEENLQGRPFVGAAGKFLDELLKNAGIKREKVFITNIIKCRPPYNRTPRQDEIAACWPYLEAQLAIIKPQVVACLGNSAATTLMKKTGLKSRKITTIHGKSFAANLFGKRVERIEIVPLYHPAFAIRNARMKNILKKDFKIVARYK